MTTSARRFIGRACLVLPLLAGLTAAPQAEAQWRHGGYGGYGGGYHREYHGGGWGPGAIVGGLLGLGVAAAVLAPRPYAPPPVVYAPPAYGTPTVVYAAPPAYYPPPVYYRPY